jgi:aryl-alcohol dehydrogenase-like predicted oxidoreductase
MQYRDLGRTGWKVSEVSFGAWAIGASWGQVNDDDSLAALHRAVDLGVNFIDTADVYGDGHSERLIARLRKERSERVIVATKAGRRLSPHTADGYNRANLTQFVERSLKNLDTDSLDLLQLHCPPTDVYYRPEIFGVLDDLVAAGKIRYYGVSVERLRKRSRQLNIRMFSRFRLFSTCFACAPPSYFFPKPNAAKWVSLRVCRWRAEC